MQCSVPLYSFARFLIELGILLTIWTWNKLEDHIRKSHTMHQWSDLLFLNWTHCFSLGGQPRLVKRLEDYQALLVVAPCRTGKPNCQFHQLLPAPPLTHLSSRPLNIIRILAIVLLRSNTMRKDSCGGELTKSVLSKRLKSESRSCANHCMYYIRRSVGPHLANCFRMQPWNQPHPSPTYLPRLERRAFHSRKREPGHIPKPGDARIIFRSKFCHPAKRKMVSLALQVIAGRRCRPMRKSLISVVLSLRSLATLPLTFCVYTVPAITKTQRSSGDVILAL